MDQVPLVSEKIDAGSKFLKRFRKYAPIQAAFWMKPVDDRPWRLYLWSDQFTDENFDLAYAEVLRLAPLIDDPNFDPFEVTILRGKNSLADAAVELYERHPAPVPTRFHGRTFGGIGVEEVYVYPPPAVFSRANGRKSTQRRRAATPKRPRR